MFRFFTASVFRPTSNSGLPSENPDGMRRDLEQFMLAFDTDLAPIVGQQVTLDANNAATAGPRIDLFLARAAAAFYSKSLNGGEPVMECDVIAHVVQNGRITAYLYDPAAKNFVPDDGGARLTIAELRAFAGNPGQEITFTAATPGSGPRLISRQ